MRTFVNDNTGSRLARRGRLLVIGRRIGAVGQTQTVDYSNRSGQSGHLTLRRDFGCVLSWLRKRVTVLNSRMTHGRECCARPSGSAQPSIRYLNSSADESTVVEMK